MIEITAADAERILKDDAFRAIFDKIRQDQLKLFKDSKPGDTETWGQAHSVLSGLDAVEAEFQSLINSERIKSVRKKHNLD